MTKEPNNQDQKDLEVIFSKYQLMPVLRQEFSILADEYPIEIDRKFICDALAQLFLHKQADPVTLVGILSPKYGTPQQVSEKLLSMVQHDYADYNYQTKRFIVKYSVSDDVIKMLDRYQYPLPMITEPMQIKEYFSTGYETIRGALVLNGSIWFKDKDLCYEHINKVNSVPLTINERVISSPQGKYEKPKQKDNESWFDYHKRVKQIKVFYDTSIEVMEGIMALSDKFYLTHKYDRRGRCYASGYHINSQGDEYHKAVLELTNKEIIK